MDHPIIMSPNPKIRSKFQSDTRYELSELMCCGCAHRFYFAYPETKPLADIECLECGKTGLIIKTGQSWVPAEEYDKFKHLLNYGWE